MTATTDPCWIVTYRPAGTTEHKTVEVHAPDLVSAIRAAGKTLQELSKTWTLPDDLDAIAKARPYLITMVEPKKQSAA